MSRRHRVVAATALLGALVVLTGCASSPDPTSKQTAGASASATALSGRVGAVDYDGGRVIIGSGPTPVDVYLDAMCPYCRIFEQGNGPMLLEDAAADRITLRIHPVAVLDRFSRGSCYSTRAAASIINVAAHHPDKVGAYLDALYAHQPEENTRGLSDEDLAELATDAETPLVPGQHAAEQAWVRQHTDAALNGPLPETQELPSLRTVPAVLVDGAYWQGDSTDTTGFRTFYRDNLR